MDEPIIFFNKKNWVGKSIILRKNVQYNIEDVTSICSDSSSVTVNLVTTHQASVFIHLNNGKTLNFHSTSLVMVSSKVSKVRELIDYIQRKTFQQRIGYYIEQLETKGFITYRKYTIYKNSDIKHKKSIINIAESGLEGGVTFGRKSSFGFNSFATPNEIWIEKKSPGIWNKQICLKTKEDKDVIFAIVSRMAEYKGGRINIER